MNHTGWRELASRTLLVLGAGLLGALLTALIVYARSDDVLRPLLLYYYVPLAFPLAAFAFDRVERRRRTGLVQWLIDLPVLALSLARAFVPIPLISGHALFLTYALLTARSWVALVTATAVAVQVIHLKVSLRDATLIGGAALGCLAAVAYRRAGR